MQFNTQLPLSPDILPKPVGTTLQKSNEICCN